MADSGLDLIGLRAVLETADFEKGMSVYQNGISDMETQTDKAAKETAKSTEDMSRKQEKALQKVGLAFAAVGAAATALLTSIAMTASRTEELGVILDVTAENARRMAEANGDFAKAASLTADAVNGQVDAVKELGITTQAASQLVALMIRYNLDWTKATDLARLAQDAATFAAQDTSEALQGLIHGITTLNPRVLRTYGILVNLDQEYQKFADANNVASTAITSTEKQQIALNAALAQAPAIAGAYEAAMETASKQIRSLKRDTTEVAEAFGEFLTPALNSAVGALRDVLHWMKDLPDPVQATAVQLGVAAAGLMSFVGAAALVLPKVIGLITAFKELALVQSLASAGMLGPVGLVAGLAAAAAALAIYSREVEKAHRKEAAEIADTSESYEKYITLLDDAELGSYALSESLYEIAESADAAATGIDALTLIEAFRELEGGLGTIKTGVEWIDKLTASLTDNSYDAEWWLKTLERIKPTLSTAEKYILTDEDAVRKLGESMSLTGADLEAFIEDTLKSTKAFAMQQQALKDAAEMQAAYDREMEKADLDMRALRMTADEFTEALLRQALALEGNIDLLEKYDQQAGSAVEDAASRMVDAEERAAESRQKAHQDLIEAQENLEKDHAKVVVGLLDDIADVDEDLKDDLLEAEEKYQKERSEVSREYLQDILDAERELAQDEQDLKQDTLRKLEDLQREYAQDLEDAERDLARDLESMEQDHLSRMEELRTDYYADMEALQRSHGEKVTALQESYAKQQQAIEKKYQIGPEPETFDERREELQKLLASMANRAGIDYGQDRREIMEELEKLKAEELAALEERKSAELDELQQALADEQAEREAAYQVALDAEQKAYEDRQAERQRQYDQDLHDLALAREREREEIRIDQERRLSDLRAGLAEEKRAIEQRYQERLAALSTQLQEERKRLEEAARVEQGRLQAQLAEEIQSYSERSTELRKHYDAQIQEISSSLAEEQEKVRQGLADELREIITGLGEQSKAFQGAYANQLLDLERYLGDRLERERQYQQDLEHLWGMGSPSKWMVDFGKNITAGLEIGLGPSLSTGLADALASFQDGLGSTLGTLHGGIGSVAPAQVQPVVPNMQTRNNTTSISNVRNYNLSADFSNSNLYPQLRDQFRLIEMAAGH